MSSPTETSKLLTPEERANAAAKFANLTHRSTRLRFLVLGPVVAARDPKELEQATIKALAEQIMPES